MKIHNFPSIRMTAQKTTVKKQVLKSTQKKHKPVVGKVLPKKTKKPLEVVPDILLLQPIRGMRDILPNEQPYWERLRKALAVACQEYGFGRIDMPVMEYSQLYLRSIGEGTDIIDKEIYAFTTRGEDKVALRPELTAGLARAFMHNGMGVLPKPIRLFSTGPVYRYERPQEGRYREHYQANFDVFGESDPILDAQIIHLAQRVVSQIGLKHIEFRVNNIGTSESRKEYEKILVRYFEFQKHKLCQNCRDRLISNPLRILDCKEDKCAQLVLSAPKFADSMDKESKDHFAKVLEYLDELRIPYIITPQLVRGLDYYTRTVFEIYSTDGEGKKVSLGGGGRYDRLIQSLGGEETPAIGFGLGLDRLVAEMQRLHVKPYQESKPKVFLAQLGDLAKRKSLRVFADLQKNGILVAESFGRGSLKSQMRAANRLGVEVTLILGQKEALDETVILKDMVSGTQETVTQVKLVNVLKRVLKMHPSHAMVIATDDDSEA